MTRLSVERKRTLVHFIFKLLAEGREVEAGGADEYFEVIHSGRY